MYIMSFYFYIELLYVFNYMYAYIFLYVRIYIICIYICTCRVIIYIQYIHMNSTICMHTYLSNTNKDVCTYVGMGESSVERRCGISALRISPCRRSALLYVCIYKVSLIPKY